MRTRTRPTRRQRGVSFAALLAMLALAAIAPISPSFARSADPVAGPPSTDFTISSFNVLGASHTRNSAKYATGTVRMNGVLKILTAHDVDVVGFQELQSVQLAAFLAGTAGTFAVYPGTELRALDGENSLAWRTDTWDLVEASTVPVPYFNGNLRQMPVIKLRNKATGMTAWFANFHNPATNRKHPRQDRWRRAAIQVEVALANQLHATGVPVFFTGDMNERQKVFCPVTGEAPMRAARGGTNRNGVCDAQRPWYVDWIFGAKGITFNGYVEDRSPLVKRTTDHPVIVSDAHIDPTRFPLATVPPLTVPDPPITG
jgi:hypothetical protein